MLLVSVRGRRSCRRNEGIAAWRSYWSSGMVGGRSGGSRPAPGWSGRPTTPAGKWGRRRGTTSGIGPRRRGSIALSGGILVFQIAGLRLLMMRFLSSSSCCRGCRQKICTSRWQLVLFRGHLFLKSSEQNIMISDNRKAPKTNPDDPL